MTKQIELSDDETLDDLNINNLKIIQSRRGYRFSIDPVLLCTFSSLPNEARVMDLGTGSGVIPLILASRDKSLKIVGLEYQPGMVERARRSVQLNALQESVEIVAGDVRDLPGTLTAESFDVVTCNPPYRTEQSGRIAPNGERAAARHELAGGLADFVLAASSLLTNGGRFYVIFLAERLAELTEHMGRQRLEPKRLRMVHPRAGEPANLVLVEGRKGGRPGMLVEPPLMIYRGAGRDYTDEVLAMYEGRSGIDP